MAKKQDDAVLEVLRSIDHSLAQIASALSDDSEINQSLALIAGAVRDDAIRNLRFSIDFLAQNIRGPKSENGGKES